MNWARHFEPCSGCYLLSHSVGRLPVDATREFADRYIAPWTGGAAEPWGAWLEIVEDFRVAVAALIGARAAEICPQANLSAGLAKVLQSLPGLTDRREILLSERDFPSMGFVIDRARALGCVPRFLPPGTDERDPGAWAAQLTEETALALVTHAQSNTGVAVPVREICAAARAVGALSVVDAAQSVGILPLDTARLEADFLLGSCVKWLCGGPGNGFLWVREALLERCEPMDVGWFSHAQPFEFDIRRFRYHPDALRFWGGTPAVASQALALPGLRLLAEIGVERLRAHNLSLGNRLLAGTPSSARVSPAEPSQRSGTVVLDFGSLNDAVAASFTSVGVSVDRRPTGFRLSPHIYNSERDIDIAVDAIQRVIAA